MEKLLEDIPVFKLSKGGSKAIELLNESMYSSKILQDQNSTPENHLLHIYRLLFQLINLPDINHTIKDDSEFWRRAVSYFKYETKEVSLGKFISSLTSKIDFSDENVYIMNKLLGSELTKLVPANYSKACGTTGLIVFFVKEAFEYAGVLIDEKKNIPAKIYKNLMYNFDMLNVKLERVKSVLNIIKNGIVKVEETDDKNKR